MANTAKYAFIIRLKSAPGKEADVERLIHRCLLLARDEPATVNCYGMRLDPTTFGIFSVFETDEGLERHLSGHLGLILEAAASEILAAPSLVEQVEILEAKT